MRAKKILQIPPETRNLKVSNVIYEESANIGKVSGRLELVLAPRRMTPNPKTVTQTLKGSINPGIVNLAFS
jgi:ribosomal protein L1